MDFGVNFIRNFSFGDTYPMYGHYSQYDAKAVNDNTEYGQFIVSLFGESEATQLTSKFGWDIPWLYGNDYTDWAIDKYASLGIKWIRDFALVGGQSAIEFTAPTENINGINYASGPIVLGSDLDWSILDRTVARTAAYGIKLVLALVQPRHYVGSPFALEPGDETTERGYCDRDLYYFVVPHAVAIAQRYQNYSHIYLDVNEWTSSQFSLPFIAKWQRAIYNGVKNALPEGKKNNIKVQLLSQFMADIIDTVNYIGTENIYDEYVTFHTYGWYPVNTFSSVPAYAAGIRSALDALGRTDIKIKIDEFGGALATQEEWENGQWFPDYEGAETGYFVPLDTTLMAPGITNMYNTASATGLIDAVLCWPTYNFGFAGLSIFNITAHWDYINFNQNNMPEPFTLSPEITAIVELELRPTELIPDFILPNVATVLATPYPGIYNTTQYVTLSMLDSSSATILYTLDGTDPDPSELYVVHNGEVVVHNGGFVTHET